MRKIKRIIFLFIIMFSLVVVTSCKDNKQNVNEIITQKVEYEQNITVYDIEDALVIASEKAEASVVGVESSNRLTSAFGSGVIIKCVNQINGYKYYVVTNFHVLSMNNKPNPTISVYLGLYKETLSATIEEYDTNKDIAIISFVSPRELSVASIGDSTNIKKAQFAIAIGNPYDLEIFYNSVTVGYISFPNRECLDDNNIVNYYIQHTAPINSGNSGGGLFDIYGNLIGINTWKYATEEIEGMGFSIPIHIVQQLYPMYF